MKVLQFAARGLASLITTVLFALFAILGVAGYLANSHDGSRWLFDLARDFAPGQLQAQEFSGRLSGPLEIHGLSYRDGELQLTLQRLRLDWRPSTLFKLQLMVNELALAGARLHLPKSEASVESPPAEPFGGFSLPIAVVIESLLLDDIQLVQPEAAEPLVLQHLALAARAEGDRLHIEALQAAGFDAQVDISGELRLVAGMPMDLELAWRYQLPEGPQLQGSGNIQGDLLQLKLGQTLAAPLSARLDATLFELESEPRWDASMELDQTDLGAFAPGFPARLSGRVQSAGNPDKLAADARLTLVEPGLGEVGADLLASYEHGVARVDKLLLTTPTGVEINSVGRYTPDDEQGSLEWDLNWSALRWPLIGDELLFSSREGKARVQGSPADYRYELDLAAELPGVAPAAKGAAVPPVPIGLQGAGQGNLDGLSIERLDLSLAAGHIQATGKASWAPRPGWRLQLNGTDVNPGLLHPDFPGSLALVLNTEGEIRDPEGPLVRLDLKSLQGILRDYPLRASGRIAVDGETIDLKAFEVDSGGNHARVEGSAGKRLALDWSIQAPKLEALWPGLEGALKGKGRLSGAAESPRIQADLNGDALRFEDNQAGSLRLKADMDLGGGQTMDLDLSADSLAAGGMSWTGLSLQAKGSRAKHHIELDLVGKDVPQAKLALDAGLDAENIWSGSLQKLHLQIPDIGDWSLRESAAFLLGEHKQRLQLACLVSGKAQLCTAFDGQAGKGWKPSLEAPDFPLDFFQPWLPAQSKISGRSRLLADFTADSKGRIKGRADLALPKGALDFELTGQTQKLDFSGGAVKAALDAKGAHLDVNLPLAELGGIRSQVDLPGLSVSEFDMQKQAIKGHIQARIEDLGLVSAVAPDITNVKGRIAAEFDLKGTLANPRLKGSADLLDAALDIPEAGLELRELVFKLRAPTLERLNMEGGVRSGDGTLSFSGETRLDAENGFPTTLKVQGKDWMAVNIPEAELHVSPDINISHNKTRSELDGELRIPYARIRPRELPTGAVSGSSDLVVLGGENPDEQSADTNFHSKLRIIFGDRVSFDGFGLRAKLSGNLLVIDEPGRPVIGRGKVGIAEGSYRAYGQDLRIERGYALFADSPVDNPGLDVRAVREANEVTAGLRVTGTLKTPKLKLFSSPTMEEGDILSYLLTGHAPGESGSNVGVSAALAASGVGSLSSEVGRQIGLEELRVEAGSSLANASVVAGTYLSPRLYVQYVNELASRETKLRLRYDLTKKLQIQTESGRSQGVDIFYTIEH